VRQASDVPSVSLLAVVRRQRFTPVHGHAYHPGLA
jgi:hypothetical protein